MYQQAVVGMSHISFGEEETASPKKSISQAKQRELMDIIYSHPPPEIQPRPLAARALALRESITIGESTPHNSNGGECVVKTAKKIPNQKLTELSGNNIFKGDDTSASVEKPLSSAKLREMSGSNIFADGKAESRDYLGGVRKPPGGESSIALV
ncbi:unnamed protein product [Lactuca virosa]|uniref:DUF4057 domain-containing protein n=1 Tax=Lactuca virosa TaxID=75947 RepID=A0AAU9PV81_9ASTR|nr:unnamed protein product [Lactuca virosa]